MNVRIPKYEDPILAEIQKQNVTDTIDVKISIQDWGSNSFRRFQVGAILEGYLENQYIGVYLHPAAQVATFPRAW